MILLISTAMVEFSGYVGNEEMLEIMDSMPPALLAAFQLEAFNLTTVTGFFGYMFSFFVLLSGVYASMLGSDIISKEERDKTVEFSLTLPIPRWKIITFKIIAAVINCITFVLIIWVTSLANANQYRPDETFYVFMSLGMVALFITQMIFLAVGVFLGCALRRHKRTNALAVSILLGTYFLSIISGLKEDWDFLKYITPFKYFNPAMLLNELKLDVTFLWISVGIIVIALVGGYVTYSRRDLYI